MRAGWRVLLWLGLCVSCVSAQELSTSVYPSEDELEQALTNHDIDIIQFLELRELLRYGIDSTHLYLIDVIPNLTYADPATPLLSSLESEQLRPFRLPSFFRGDAQIRWKISYAHRLEGDSLSRYFQSLSVKLTPHLSTDLRIAKEYTSDARLTGRSVLYQNSQGTFRRIVGGNYYARFGLGGVIGYRSPLLAAEEEVSTENLLFPDYTGYNGAMFDARWNKRLVRGLFSLQRDTLFTAFTAASEIEISALPNTPALILSLTSLRNRATDRTRAAVTGSVYERYAYAFGHIAGELIAQGEDNIHFGGLVVSGEHKKDNVAVIYQGWAYGDNFRDLTTGSLSGTVRRKTDIESIGFSYLDRHRGQEGITVRTSVPLSTKARFLTNATIASVNHDTTDVQLLMGATTPLSKSVTGRVDYLAVQKIRTAATTSHPVHQLRLETTVTLGRLVSRQYIAACWNNSAGQLGILLNPRYTLNDGSEIEVWFSSRQSALDETDNGYTYMFVRTAYHLFSQGLFSVKLSHRFRHEGDISSQSTLTGNLELQW